jgi:hypothetical protein
VDRRNRDANPRGSSPETTPRKRQQTTRRDIAAELDIDREGVGSIERIGGLDVFLRGPGPAQFDSQVREQFASEADFVESGDVDAQVNAQDIAADPQVAPDRRPAVAQRARRATADTLEYITPADLDAQVGAFGVRELGVADDRRDDVASRAAAGLASEDPYAEAGDFSVEVGDRGIKSAGLSDTGARQRAGRQFESETALGDVDPSRDIQAADGGFGLTSGAQRRLTAREFESQFSLFGSGELDPSEDIREVGGGFGLARGPAREVAAADLDRQIGEVDISPDDITLEPTDSGGFEATFETEVQR